MKNLATTFSYFVCFSAMFGVGAQAQDEIVFAELGGVQLVSKPVDLGRDDYLATVVEIRAVDPNASLTTFTNISITGEVAQLHGSITSALSPQGNAFKEAAGPLYGVGWSTFDTHLLIEMPMIGDGNWSLLEANDGSLTYGHGWWCSALAEITPKCTTVAPIAGIGSTHFGSPNDAFSLLPEFRQSSLDFAYIVTPANTKTETEVRMTLGLLGAGIVNAGEVGGAAFGYDGNPEVVVPFAVPESSNSVSALLGLCGWIALRRIGVRCHRKGNRC